MSDYVDFEELKRATNIEYVAWWLNLPWKREGVQLRTRCPHGNGGKRSLCVTPEKGEYYCFAPSCLTGGSYLDLIAHVHKIELREAALMLKKHLWPEGEMKELDYLVHDSPQIAEAGMPPHVAAALNAGYSPKGSRAGYILFPLRLPSGKLIGYLPLKKDGEHYVLKFHKQFFL